MIYDGEKTKLVKELGNAFSQYGNDILRFCLSRTYNKDLAEDITQESFIHTWKYMCSHHQIDNMRAFLYRVANNLIIDESRKRKNYFTYLMKIKMTTDVFVEGANQTIHQKLRFEGVLNAIHGLPEKYRQILLMRYVRDMQIKDIAQRLHKSENVISVNISRGLDKLRKMQLNGEMKKEL